MPALWHSKIFINIFNVNAYQTGLTTSSTNVHRTQNKRYTMEQPYGTQGRRERKKE
jgi:hypothetical protein